MRKEFKGHHLTEAYDHMLPPGYKTKDFSRLDKSFMEGRPNHLGDTHIAADKHKNHRNMRHNDAHIDGGYRGVY
ncbi:MAG TPA: hypothetical protein VNX68_12965 [Nitrosopumilaceae archaeon]|jgi:hypothetical protein|nr:hypothetical protein [Nitrosopumilaceae archaeon]